MAKEKNILVLTRADLHLVAFTTPIEELKYIDFKNDISLVHKSPFVIFIDTDGKTKLMKNRYGNTGMVENG